MPVVLALSVPQCVRYWASDHLRYSLASPPLPCHLTGKTKDPTVWAVVLLLRHLMGSPIVWGYTWKPFPKDKKRIMKLQEGWHMLVILVLGEVEIRGT